MIKISKFSKEIIERNEEWIQDSYSEILELENKIEKERTCIRDLAKQNRELKGRE